MVIAIISLLVSILLPSLHRARELARRMACAVNLHHLGTGIYLYASDFDDHLPPYPPGAMALDAVTGAFRKVAENYGMPRDTFYCPSRPDSTKEHRELLWNYWVDWSTNTGQQGEAYPNYQNLMNVNVQSENADKIPTRLPPISDYPELILFSDCLIRDHWGGPTRYLINHSDITVTRRYVPQEPTGGNVLWITGPVTWQDWPNGVELRFIRAYQTKEVFW